MKKLTMILGIVLSVIMMASCASQGNLTKQQKADMKNIKKLAKEYKKEGWQVAFGHPSMEAQLSNVFNLRAQVDDKGLCKYFEGDANSIGENYDAAHFMALNQSKIELAGKIESQIVQLIETAVDNQELSDDQAASLVKSASAAKTIVAQKLGRVITPVDVYRKLPNGNTQVRIITMYSIEYAMDTYKQTIRQDLEKKSDELAKQLNSILKF